MRTPSTSPDLTSPHFFQIDAVAMPPSTSLAQGSPAPPIQTAMPSLYRRQPLTLPLDCPSSTASSAGGKGHNLSVLARCKDGVRVPPGFVVTTAAYRDFVDGDLRATIDASLARLHEKATASGSSSGHAANPVDLETASAEVRAAFRRRNIPEALRAEISDRLAALARDGGCRRFVAVRSSATCEDAPGASFAGQHDTYLNVPADDADAADDVCARVVDCFSSLYSARAISYRESNGISRADDDAAMAVVVQAMAAASGGVESPSRQRASGVLFTANPLTGRRRESVVEAVPGLGEALVSGLTEPDRYVVAWRDDEDGASLEILDKKVGMKAKAIHEVKGGGVNEQVVPQEEAKSTVLDDDEVKHIVQIGQMVETLFNGEPQDIEFALTESGQVFIVQSRPITTMFPLPDVPPDPLQVFFSFNAIQGIIAPIYPFGEDVIRTDLLGGLLRWITWGRFGNEGTYLQPVARRLYVNVTNVLRNSVGRRVLRILLSAVEPGIKAGLEQIIEDSALEVNSGMSAIFFLRLTCLLSTVIPRTFTSILFPVWSRERLLRRMDDYVKHIEDKVAAAKSLSDTIELKRQILGSFFPQMVPHFIPRMYASMGPLFILGKLASSVPNGKDLVLTVTRGLHNNVTTEMDLELWRVAVEIRSDPDSFKRFGSCTAESLSSEYLQRDLPCAAQTAISSFLRKYGMRGLYEIDFGRPRWREDPAPLMNTIKSYVEIEEDLAPDKMFAKGENQANNAIVELGQRLRKPWLVSFFARRVRCLAGIRELPKFTAIRIMGCLRAKMLQEGSKLVESGVIDDAKDLFFLQADEVDALERGCLRDCKAIIQERKDIMERECGRFRLPRVIASDGFAAYGGATSTTGAEAGTNVLCGEPVSPGIYEGRIQIIHDPSKEKLTQGHVLCCHGTDPSWTPLFLSAGALVMEVGGLMTHGSVVAREYGIPAVVGISSVTERLFTGQLVRVDGGRGVVEVIDEARDLDP